jgi:hypothetical protein
MTRLIYYNRRTDQWYAKGNKWIKPQAGDQIDVALS